MTFAYSHESLEKYNDPDIRQVLFDVARTAVGGFEFARGLHERPDLLSHAERTVKLMGAFAGELLPEPAYHAAIMHDLAQRFDNSTSDGEGITAAQALDVYFSHAEFTKDEKRYVSALLGDMRKIGGAAGAYTRKFSSERDLSEEEISILADNGHRQKNIPSRLWEVEEPRISTRRLRKISRKTNFESIVILAAEKIDHLQNPSSDDEAKLLHDILEAETFYAPLCEFWGLDAMAMTLKSAASKRRLEKRGMQDAIDRAECEYKNAVGFGGPEQVLAQLFGEGNCERRYNIEPIINGSNNKLAKFCEVVVGVQPGGPMRFVGRIKSVGSLAKKMIGDLYGASKDMPMDVIGLTAITKDVDDLATRFRQVLDLVYQQEQSGGLELKKPASKIQPIYIQGSAEFKQRIKDELADHPLADRVEIKDKEEPFQVAKFTCVMNGEDGKSVNVEMQFLTEEDRKRARRGNTAHALRDYRRRVERDARGRIESELVNVEFASEEDRNSTIDALVAEEVLSRVAKRAARIDRIFKRKGKVNRDSLDVNERTHKRGRRFLGRLALVRSTVDFVSGRIDK